ncbi:S8 family serine peptidase [Micromonospora sp. NBC_01796]|uniref:S8 family serine peptidase n=1 Tax=Micromonospora sp. NBC_01796 TaxID=2975987 RepID=UPI002DDB7B43|nr:S8 family serine peptidase [Micromonospora sp. NBC_01796]WSA85065.1 S8 family serine peptidase [Micromonospora sp. NBC_01796]
MRRPVRTVTMAVACLGALLAGAVGPGATGHAAVRSAQECADPGQPINPMPWPQQMLGPERAWSFSQGGGVTVAVLDSGVDGSHPQLAGRVAAGFDAVAGGGSANDDCVGTGTQVAGVIAAGQAPSVGFVGLAPGVRILPIRVLDDRGGGRGIAEPDVLARGIDAAANREADVLAVSAVSYTDSPSLRDAVARAVARGIVVVAAVGDRGDENGASVIPYPAAYPGVVGVGAIDQAGERWRGSQQGTFVDLVAPGAAVPTLQRGAGMIQVDGTGVACAFVAASVALVHARRGNPTVDEVVGQLLATTIPAAGGDAYGHGIVNPYGAVTDRVAGAGPVPLPAMVRPPTETSPALARSRNLAIAGSVVALLVVLTVLVTAVALPRGRRRLWRSASAAAPVGRAEPEEPGPPVPLFPAG